MEKVFCVYMTTNKRYGTLYTGMSGQLPVRVFQHKEKMADGFTKKYNLTRLVYYETHATAEAAAYREKCIKEWKREWKIRLIEEVNPEWRDLFDDIAS